MGEEEKISDASLQWGGGGHLSRKGNLYRKKKGRGDLHYEFVGGGFVWGWVGGGGGWGAHNRGDLFETLTRVGAELWASPTSGMWSQLFVPPSTRGR